MKKDEILSMEELFCEIVDKGEESLFYTRSREGIFSPALVMWLEISNRVEGRKSLLGALTSLGEGNGSQVVGRNIVGSKPLKEKRVSISSGGLCRARQRLGVDEVERVCRLISTALLKEGGETNLWNSKRVYLMDGTIISLQQSKRTFSKYAPVANQNGTCKTGQLICTCIHDLFTGIALSPAFGAYTGANAIGETRLGKMMIQRLWEPGVIIGDRAFGIFSTAWTAKEHGHEVLLRLTATRAESIRGKYFGAVEIDEEVVWEAGNLNLHPEIPTDAKVRGRVIHKIVKRKGFKPLSLVFFTTLKESVEELALLYQQRERIENDIRSLKYTLEMEMLNAKSPEVLEKELLLGFAANNLVRAVLARAARKLKIPARKISFMSGLTLTKAYGNKLRDAKDPKQRRLITDRFLTGLYQTKLPNRTKQRMEPRKVTRLAKQFPFMKKSRDEERADALKVAQEHGHRGFFTTVTRKY